MAHSNPLAVGIDLGTTFSAVAYLDDLGRPVTLQNGEGDKITPSVILFEGNDVIVGKEAVKAFATDYDDIAECAMFLASDAAAYITGENITVDGGVIHSVLAQLPRE